MSPVTDRLRLASWNVNSLKVRLPHLLEWLDSAKPDLLGLQETKLQDAAFPEDALREAGYQCLYTGQKTYNGVAVLARDDGTGPLLDPVTDLPGYDDPQRRVLAVTWRDVRFVNLYVPNGSEVGSDKYTYKLEWLEHLQRWLEAELVRHDKVVVVGDFNIAPADADVHDPEEWRGRILFSEPEHAALQKLESLGFQDTFRLFQQEDKCFSWWDYRMNNFRRNRGLRIDLILASPAMAGLCLSSGIDRTPRTWDRPSDHAPVLADFALAATGSGFITNAGG